MATCPLKVSRLAASVLCVAAAWLLPQAALAQSDAAHQQFLFAYKLLQRGDDREAAAEFDSYLKRYPEAPKRGDGLYYRALLHRRAEQAGQVVALLNDARRPAPQLVPAYAVDLLLGQSLSDLARWPEATAVLQRIDADALANNGQGDVAVSVRYLRGLAYRGADQLGKAAEELAAAANPAAGAGAEAMRARALVDLARVQVQRGDAAAALEALDGAIALGQADSEPEAARFAGDVAYENGDPASSVAYYDRVIRGYPGSPHYGASVVGKLWALYASGKDAAVVDSYEALVATLPLQDRVAAGYLAGSAKQRQNDHPGAVALLEPLARGRGELPLEARVMYRLAVSYHALGQDGRVIEVAKRLRGLFPDSPLNEDAGFLAASSTARAQGAEAGAAELTRYIEQGPEHPYYLPALRQRAALYEQNNELEAALRDYGRWLSVESPILFDDEAMDALDNPTPPTRESIEMALSYGRVANRLESFEDANTVLGGAFARLNALRGTEAFEPALSAEALYRSAVARIGLGRDDEALQMLETLQDSHPLSAFAGDAALKRGAVLRRLGRDREALEVWIAAVDGEAVTPTQRALALRAMASVYRQAGRDADAAVTLLRASRENGPAALDNEELLWMARQALRDQQRAGDNDASNEALAAARALLAVLDTEGRAVSEPQRSEQLFLRGRVALAAQKFDEASEAFQGVIARGQGFDLDAQLGLAEIAEANGDPDAALAQYAELTRAPETAVAAEAMLRQGLVLVEQPSTRGQAQIELREARRSIKKMVLLYLDSPDVQPTPQHGLVVLAEIADRLGEPDTALREYAELTEHFPDTTWGRYAAAILSDRRDRRPDDALAALQALGDLPLDPALDQRVTTMRSELEARR